MEGARLVHCQHLEARVLEPCLVVFDRERSLLVDLVKPRPYIALLNKARKLYFPPLLSRVVTVGPDDKVVVPLHEAYFVWNGG